MDLLSFHVVPNWLARAARTMESVIRRTHTVTLERNAEPLDVRVGGRSQGAFKVRLSDTVDPERLHAYVDRYRRNPATTRPDGDIREAFHNFLFAGGRLDGPFVQEVDSVAAVHIRIPSTSRLTTALPWELTDGPPTAGRGLPLLGTLAARPLARVLTDVVAPTTPTPPDDPAPLTVLLAVNEPEDDPFGAEQFLRLFSRRFHGSGIDATHAGDRTRVTLEELRAQANRVQPHVVVLVAHGRTDQRMGSEIRLDSWVRSGEVGAALTERRSPLLVLLIACDQADSAAAAESGAVALLNAGVPAVVAMQSSVQATLAAEFLLAVLDGFFQGMGVEGAVAAGRRRMAPEAEAEKHVEWSFPALFLQDGATLGLADLSEYIASRGREYERLVRAITPPPRPYVSRPMLEDALSGHLRTSVGLVVLTGGLGVGKTALARYCARRHSEAVAAQEKECRPLLYVDLDRFPGGVSDRDGLLSILKDYTAEAGIHDAYALFRWPSARDAGGELRASTLLETLDQNRTVVVLDHAEHLSPDLHGELAALTPRLQRSLVVLVRQPTKIRDAEDDPTAVVTVRPMDRDEAAEFCGPSYSDDLFDAAGGIPLLLKAAMEQSNDVSKGFAPAAVGPPASAQTASNAMLSVVPPDLEAVLHRLAHFPNGVNSAFGTRYVGEWRAVLNLEATGVLVTEERYQLGDRWLRVPGLLTQHLRETEPDRFTEAGAGVRDAFDRDVADDSEHELTSLAKQPGGISLLHDLQATCIALGDWPRTRAIPVLLHGVLYALGRWADDAQLWQRYLVAAPFEATSPADWVLAAKSMHLLGHADQARSYLEHARLRPLTAFSAAQSLMIQAALLKDSGDRLQADRISELYQTARDKIEEAADERGVDRLDIEKERAALDYNQAIFARWWLRESNEAVLTMARARESYAAIGDAWMEAVAASELVDMQIDLPTDERPSTRDMIDSLFQADAQLEALDNCGDRAWLYYRLHRAYRKHSGKDADVNAMEAVQRAIDFAREAGDERLEMIGRAHAFELRVRNPNLADAGVDDQTAVRLIDRLATFAGDAWTARVRRDTWVNLALMRAATGDQEGVGEAWANAWVDAISPPLSPDNGTDARRAQGILCARMHWLIRHAHPLDVDALWAQVRDRLEAWFGANGNTEDFLNRLCLAGAFSGELTTDPG